MKLLAAFAMVICFAPSLGRSAELNLATTTCDQYENEVLPSAATNPSADSINTVMWLLGYSVAKSGAHVLYPEALGPFGFALDGECKTNPAESLLEALTIVKPETKNPMDLALVECGAFAARHVEFARSDAESANTIMMGLFGFYAAKSGSHLFVADAVHIFESALLADCAKHPTDSLFDSLKALKPTKAGKSSAHP